MICYMCGRVLSDDAVVCKGCGAQQRHAEKVKRDSIVSVMKSFVSESSSMKVWQLCLSLFLAISLLIGVYAVSPSLSRIVKDMISDRPEVILPAVDQEASEIDKVSGEILILTSKIADCVVESEKAYDDESWEKTFIVNGSIKVKTLRYTANEDWINTHVYALYPDVQNVSAITPAPSYSDCTAIRIRIGETSYAQGCTVEVVLAKTDKYDHIFIVEMPNELFEEYEVWIDEWIDSLDIIDADIYYSTQNI